MQTLTILTWNCFGTAMSFKAILKRRGPPDEHRMRHPAVLQELSQADVLCMQERWIIDAMELFDALSFPHKACDPNDSRLRPLTIAGSGLAVASRHPVVSHENRAFRERGWGTDRGARKGLLHVRVQLDGRADRELDVLTTHVQAGFSQRSSQARTRQLAELREAADELGSPDRPLVVCGDMNIDGLASARNDEYARLMDIFAGYEDLGAVDDQPTMCPDAAVNTLAHRYWSNEPIQRIDYALYRKPSSSWLQVDRVERALDQLLSPDDGPATHASDHFGLRVHLRIGEQAHS